MRCIAALLLLLVMLGVGCVVTPVPLPNPSLAEWGAGQRDATSPSKSNEAGNPDGGIQPKREMAVTPFFDMAYGPDQAGTMGDASVRDTTGELRPTELGPASDGAVTDYGLKDATGAGEK